MKLWTVTVEIDYLVLADDERQATMFARQAIDDASPTDCASAREWDGRVPSDWSMVDLVYGKHKTNISVADAIKIHEGTFVREEPL